MTRSCGAPTVSDPLFSRSVLTCAGYCTMIEAERKSECLAICRDLDKDADVFLASSWVTADVLQEIRQFCVPQCSGVQCGQCLYTSECIQRRTTYANRRVDHSL